MEVFNTKNYHISFDDSKKEIYMQDTTDQFNLPSAYNRKKRGYKQFKNAILSAIQNGDCTTFNTWLRVADEKFDLNMHYYCAMD